MAAVQRLNENIYDSVLFIKIQLVVVIDVLVCSVMVIHYNMRCETGASTITTIYYLQKPNGTAHMGFMGGEASKYSFGISIFAYILL